MPTDFFASAGDGSMSASKHALDAGSTDQVQPSWLAGNSEMATRMRAKNWAESPLGPIEGWSPTLQTTTSILLANRFPMLLWWGPDSISIYNDAYIPVLGVKHPDALGLPVRACWSEVYDILRPLIITPLNGGPATWSEDLSLELRRHGFLEETHWTVAYSPVPDETAPRGIGGVLATVHEITAQVVSDRRGALLRELGACATEGKSAEEACAAAAQVFEQHRQDVPFSLIYLVDQCGESARLVASTGVDPTGPNSPREINLKDDAEGFWPVGALLRTETPQLFECAADENSGFSQMRHDAPVRALVVLIESNLSHQPAGILILGLNSLLALDAGHRGFVDLVSTQLSKAIAHAQAYQAERQRAEALAQLDRAKTTFFSNVSHELRTPLTLILGMTQQALDAPQQHLSGEELAVVHRNGLRLLRLVNTLLDFSRIEGGRIDARYVPTDLSRLTLDLAGTFRSAIEGAGLGFDVDCAPLDEPVYVDGDMWEKIVLNLLSNAFKFTIEGSIRISLQQTGDAIELQVQDTGIGIAQDELPKIFERFHRIRETHARSHEGTGIGLSLVNELVKQHGGSLHATSERGAGSIFRVRIPRGHAHLQPERLAGEGGPSSVARGAPAYVEEALRWLPAPSEAERGTAQSLRREDAPSPARVLVADDNADMRDYFGKLLGQAWDVETVRDGQAALDSALHSPPDVILTDVMMPGLDGLELLAKLRSHPETRDVPVILVSARAGEEARVEGLRAGADDYLVKPFFARELVAKVDSQIRLAQMRRQSASTLRESEAKYRGFFDSIDAGFCLIEVLFEGERPVDYRIIEANAAFEKQTGLRDSIGRRVREMLPDHEQHWSDIYGKVTVTGEPIRFQNEARALGRFYDVYAFRVGTAEQRLVAVLFHDITEQKRAAEALRRSDELKAYLLQLSDGLRSLSDPVEVQATVTYIARSYFKADRCFYCEINDHRVLIRRDSAREGLASVVGAQALDQMPIFRSVLETGRQLVVSDTHTSQAVDASLRQLCDEFQIRSFLDIPVLKEGVLVGIFCLTQCVPRHWTDSEVQLANETAERAWTAVELARSETALRDSESRLRESDRRKDEFLAMLGHELRNPLAVISNTAQLMRLTASEDGRLSRAHEVLERQSRHMSRLIDGLLDLARIARGKVSLDRGTVDLRDVADGVLHDRRDEAEARGLTLTLHAPREALWLDADAVRMAQVFDNLIGNAIKFTEPGGRIDVLLCSEGQSAVVLVRDTGVGMDPGAIEAMFEPFQQGSQELARSSGGLGLGLALAKGIVELHDGTIRARSAGLGTGCEVEVRLPLSLSSVAAEVEAARSAAPAHRILLVEDNADAAESLSELLRLMGHSVEVADTGPLALELLARPVRANVVLCDIGLPGMNGYDLARVIRSEPSLASTRLIALTGYGQPEDQKKSYEAGFDTHLVKPVDFQKLTETLRDL